MTADLNNYLQDIKNKLHLGPSEEQRVLLELQGHLEDHIHDLQHDGLPYEEAQEQALREFGDPNHIAHQMYAVHTKASWNEVGLGLLPHIMFALLFAFHLWTTTSWLALFVISTALVSIQAWRKGWPKWIYPWFGYCLVAPIVTWFLALLGLATGIWGILSQGHPLSGFPLFIGILIYLPLVGWLIWKVWSPIVRYDWVMASLTLLPLPFLGSWLLFLQSNGGPFAYDSQRMIEADSATSLIFLGLAATTILFYKLGQRNSRVAVLTLATPLLMVLAAASFGDNPASLGVFLFALLSVGLLLSPALLESRLAHHQPGRNR